MNYEELIYEFLDGSLESGTEEQLFMSLSASEEMRTELKQQLAIRNAVRSDIKALTPKAESTLRIFSELGFTAPIPAPTPAPIPAPVGFWTRFAGLMGKNTSNLITGVASSVATAVMMIMLVKSGIVNFGNENNSAKNYTKSIPVTDSREIQHSNNSINLLANDKKSDNNNIKTQEPKIIYKYIYLTNDSNNNDNQDVPAKVIDDVKDKTELITSNSDFAKSHPLAINTLERKFNGFNESNLISKNIPESFNLYDLSNPDKITRFALELNRSTYFYNSQEKIAQSNPQFLNNYAIAGSYKFNEEVQVGFEYRNENFYQKFEGFDSENLYSYEQNPNIDCFSLKLKYAPEYLNFSMFKPFVQTSLGGSKIGPVGRLMLGSKIIVFDNISFLISSDYSVLGFTHNKNWFLASKWGLQIGFGYDF